MRDIEQVLAHGELLAELVRLLEEGLELPEPDFPHLKAHDAKGIERAAEHARVHWGMTADQPIDSVIRVAENAGAVVVKFPGVSAEIDALSVSAKDWARKLALGSFGRAQSYGIAKRLPREDRTRLTVG